MQYVQYIMHVTVYRPYVVLYSCIHHYNVSMSLNYRH